MAQAIRMHRTGGPEVMQLETVAVPPPGPGQVTVRNHAIGLNFIDTYHRSGLYPVPLPSGLGLEGAGVVTALGEGVDLAVGDRVAYCSAGLGAYADLLNLPAARLVTLPAAIDFDTAAAVMLKGQTVEYLLQRTHALRAGEVCLFHAAAGGVGLLFGQWAASIGAVAIGTVSTPEKAALALANGYAQVIDYSREHVLERVLAITGGDKLPVVYDGVGADTLALSLDLLQPRGLLVSFGNASGAPAPLDLQTLAAKGSLYVTRPTLLSYTATTAALRESAAAVFAKLASGSLSIRINQRYALADAARAHRDLVARRTTGSSVLLPPPMD